MPNPQHDFEVSCTALLAAKTPKAVADVLKSHPRLKCVVRVDLENDHVYIVEEDGHRHLLPGQGGDEADILRQYLPQARR